MVKQISAISGVLIIVFLMASHVQGQDVSFSQFFSNPLYLNPAFSGSIGVPRLALQYRNQWQGFGSAFNTYSAAFDFPVKKLQGGMGFYLLNDTQAANSLQSMQMNFSWSVFIRLSQNYRLHGAIQAGIHQNNLNIEKLLFADNLDPYNGNHGISEEWALLPDLKQTYADFSAGLLLYSQKHFGGFAIHHLTQPKRSFYVDSLNAEILPRKYALHFGSRLPVFIHGQLRKTFDISPQLVMQFQDNYGQVNYGLFASMRGLSAGAWFRQNLGLQYDAVILLMGMTRKQWQINYSYDIAVSGLWGQTGGTSEISLVVLLKSIDRESHLPFFDMFNEGGGFQ